MGFHLGNDSELVKTAVDYSSNLLVKAEIRVKDDTQVSGVGFDAGVHLMDPWGTPQDTGAEGKENCPIDTVKDLLVR